MKKLNAVIQILKDNTKMKSKKSKEEQIICGKTVLDITKNTINENGNLLQKSELSSDLDHVALFIGHAPLVDLEFLSRELEQYPNDILFFKDIKERGFVLFIPEKVYKSNLEVIKSDWETFSDLLEEIKEPYRVTDFGEIVCVETKLELSIVSKNIQYAINEKALEEGATIIDFDTTYIDFGVKVGVDTVIYPNTFLKGSTVIGEECLIGPDARIENSTIGNLTTVKDSTVLDSKIDNQTTVGPYAYIRPNSNIGSHVKVGDFVEVKNANIGDGTKISHLAYVGDADLGRNINVGCGVVFVNYDGKNKHRSTIRDNAFIGSNSNIIAPVEVEELAYIATGTTITKNVPSGALAVGRARQENKTGWVERKNLITKK